MHAWIWKVPSANQLQACISRRPNRAMREREGERERERESERETATRTQPSDSFAVAYREFLAPGAKMGIGALRRARLKTSSPSYRGVWEPQPPTLLGVNGTHFKIALTPFSTRRVKLAKTESDLPCYWRGGVFCGVPAANASGSIWVWMEPICE